jgi:hypothetical protein
VTERRREEERVLKEAESSKSGTAKSSGDLLNLVDFLRIKLPPPSSDSAEAASLSFLLVLDFGDFGETVVVCSRFLFTSSKPISFKKALFLSIFCCLLNKIISSQSRCWDCHQLGSNPHLVISYSLSMFISCWSLDLLPEVTLAAAGEIDISISEEISRNSNFNSKSHTTYPVL